MPGHTKPLMQAASEEPPLRSEFLSKKHQSLNHSAEVMTWPYTLHIKTKTQFDLSHLIRNHLEEISGKTHISDDFNQVVCCAASVADALHSREQVWRRVTQQHTHLMGLTSGKGERKEA